MLTHNILHSLDATAVHVLLVVFLATLIRSAFGFGEALFAVPLLVLRIPLGVAAPLAVLISITIALVVVAQDWRKIHVHSMGWLMFATVFGIPLGLALLTSSHQGLVKAILAILIIAFAVYSLIGDKPPELRTDSKPWLLGCGFTAGVLGGAYGMNGPPLAIYGAMRRWSAQQFRATLQGYFLPASILGMTGYWLKGLWVPAVTHYFLLSLPAMLPAIVLGKFMNHRLRGEIFLKYVYSALVVVGAVLLAQAWRGSL
ncbi:MAG TPA: sulfite exporter TauE/SafE family protein [Candidatus Binatia bacterium]|nr:sulfite exporter TauE/SafE family protein [Candidatus Binatia bacterium]